MRIIIVTDAWAPQINGVVRTLQYTQKHLIEMDHDVRIIHPGMFKTISCPGYQEISLVVNPWHIKDYLVDYDAVHIATEGPLGITARMILDRKSYTTSYHTDWPNYLNGRFHIPRSAVYNFLRWFHSGAYKTFVTTQGIAEELFGEGFENMMVWSRGVDTDLFIPPPRKRIGHPIWLYVGRVSREKNIDDFLDLDLPGDKVIVGSGPDLDRLKDKYPQVKFWGALTGKALVEAYQRATVFVFPSVTDTFGLVLLEAMACGLPVAAYPVAAPKDIVQHLTTGALYNSLEDSCHAALNLAYNGCDVHCRAHAETFSWKKCTERFLANLHA